MKLRIVVSHHSRPKHKTKNIMQYYTVAARIQKSDHKEAKEKRKRSM